MCTALVANNMACMKQTFAVLLYRRSTYVITMVLSADVYADVYSEEKSINSNIIACKRAEVCQWIISLSGR